MRRKLFGTWRRKALTATVTALVLVGSATAAFLVYTGAEGTANGTFGNSEETAAFTITGTNEPVLVPGQLTTLNLSITNNDPDSAHTIVDLNGTAFTSTPADCASFLVIPAGFDGVTGSYAPGETRPGTLDIQAVAATPLTCAGATWAINFNATTTTP